MTRHDQPAANRLDPFDALQDARSEARYADDPQAEPDLGEVKDAAWMGWVESPAEKRIQVPR